MARLTTAGLEIDRYVDIERNLVQNLQADVDPNIYTRDDELLGQLIQVLAGRETSIQELIEAVYNAFILSKAEGKNLDDLAALRDVTRILETASNTTRQRFIGANGGSVQAGTVLANAVTGDTFTNPSQINLNLSSCVQGTLRVNQVLNNELYSIQVNNTTYVYTSDADATEIEILTDFLDQIDTDENKTWTASLNGNLLTIAPEDPTVPISIVTTSYIASTQVIVEGFFQATATGDIAVPANTVTSILTPSTTSGVTSTTNVESYVPGRARETDEELRIRIRTTSGGDCTGTIPFIIDAVLNLVAGVSSVDIVENVDSVPDLEGRPAHSYETIVVGGLDSALGQELWRTKPVGIRQHGNTTVVITDSNGHLRDVTFTRPVTINLAVRVTYTLHPEEVFPSGGETIIRNIVVDYVNALQVNEDVIPKKIGAEIYDGLEGIDDIIVEIQTLAAPGDTPVEGNYQLTRLPISAAEFPNTNGQDVYVVQG